MKKILLLVFIISINTYSQNLWEEAFKYSTFYGGYTESNAIQGNPTFYVTQENELIETTEKVPADFMVTYGWRKLAFFQYEDKNKFYDGTENNVATRSSIGNTKGLEYLFEYQTGRQQGDKFTNKQAFIRYLAKKWLVKAEFKQNQLVDLHYVSGEARVRLPIGKKLSLSAGIVYRTYDKAYGHNPIQKYLEDEPWWSLAYNFANHTDLLYQMINPFTGEVMGYDYQWYNQQGQLIASSDADYRNSVFQNVVNRYNREELAKIGDYEQLSAIVGLDFYHYRKNFWVHLYGNILPEHYLLSGEEKYSYQNFVDSDSWMDYSAGGVIGFRITKNIGLFTELNLQKYWDREIKTIKTGINIKI